MLKRSYVVLTFVLCSVLGSVASTGYAALSRPFLNESQFLKWPEPTETFSKGFSSSFTATIEEPKRIKRTLVDDDAVLLVFVVNTTADESDGSCGDGDCSLRDAIQLANSGDTITFSVLFNTAQTIPLTLGSLALDQQLTIIGPGANLLTILDNNAVPGPTFTIAAGSNVTISGVTMTGANGSGDGAAIKSLNSTLRLDGVHITGNTSVFNYGGVYADGGVTYIVNSTFSGNTAPSGSAAAFGQFAGTAYISNSTFSGNGSSATGIGGAIYVEATSLWLRNVTITGNSAGDGGGVYFSDGLNAQLHMANSIIAGNSALRPGAGGYEICLATQGNVTSEGNNLVGDSTGDSGGCDVFGINWLPSDIRDTNPLLGPLQNNGGPTPTHALLPGSPAIDAGNNAQAVVPGPTPIALTTDQRGMLRIVDGNSDGNAIVDIGAFEVQVAPTAANVTLSGRVATEYGLGIRNALVIVSGGEFETPVMAQTGSLGYFNIEGLTAGETYTVTVSAPRYHFDEPVRVVSVRDDVTGFDFIGRRAE